MIGIDKDGVLHDSFDTFHGVLNSVLDNSAVPPLTKESVKAAYCSDWIHMLKQLGVFFNDFTEFADAYKNAYEQTDVGPLIPGARGLLEELSEIDTLVLVTNEQTTKVDRFLEKYELRSFFSEIRQPQSSKVNALRDTRWYISDTVSDGFCALEAGSSFIGVTHTYGYNTEQAFLDFAKSHRNVHIVPSLDKVADIVRNGSVENV